MSAWVTIFDVTSEPFRWGNAGEGLAAIAMVALGVAASLALTRRGRRGGSWLLALSAGVAVFFGVRTLDHRREHDDCVAALRNGAGRTLEGHVEQFDPLDSVWDRPWYESFVVGGVRVRYPLLAKGCGFHHTSLEGGPIRPGMHLRVTEWKGELLKVEVESGELKVPPHDHPPL